MGESSQGLHEPASELSPEILDRHRAIVSLMEELEAADWYDQRVAAATDPELSAILAHNRDEEKEHAAMVLEWLRRNDPALDEHLKAYLFTEGSVTEVESRSEKGEAEGPSPGGQRRASDGSLGVGSLVAFQKAP